MPLSSRPVSDAPRAAEAGACGGVMIADGTRHCFVAEGYATRELTSWDLQLTVDHIIPRSMGGAEDGPTHLAHMYCQCVQGGFNCIALHGSSYPLDGRGGSRRHALHGSTFQGTREDNVRGGKRRAELHGSPGYPENLQTANHKRWHINRGVVSLSCKFCVAAP